MPKTHGYIRRHADDFVVQREALRGAGITRPVVEEVPDPQRARPALDRLLRRIAPGDEIVVASIAALGKSLRQVVLTIQLIAETGSTLRVLDAGLTMRPGDVLATFVDALATAHGALVTERIRQEPGMGKPGHPKVADEKLAEARSLIEAGVEIAEVMRRVGIGKMSLYRHGIAGHRLPRKKR